MPPNSHHSLVLLLHYDFRISRVMNNPRLEPGDQQTHACPSPACYPPGGRRGRGKDDDGAARVPRPEGLTIIHENSLSSLSVLSNHHFLSL